MKFIYSILSDVVKHNYYENMNREFYWVGVIVNKEFQFNSNRKTESTETKTPEFIHPTIRRGPTRRLI